MRFVHLAVVALATALTASAAQAAPVIGTAQSPLNATTGSPSLILTAGSPSSALRISSTGPVEDLDFAWIDMPLNVWGGGPINEIQNLEICYQSSDANSYISQVRLGEMTTPDSSLVIYDNGTDRNSTTPVCEALPMAEAIDGLVTLSLKIVLADASSNIEIGMVRVEASKAGG